MTDAPDTQAEPASAQAAERPPDPVWYRPAWITAMVGLVSAFLTVPGVVGDYLAKQQDIEIARQKVEAVRLGNLEAKQSQEFAVVQNTLGQQGEERIFMLRYFAATLDDPEAKHWAEAEVDRLDRLATLRGEVDRQRLAITEKEAEIARLASASARSKELSAELAELRTALGRKDLEVSALRQQAESKRAARGSP